MRVEKHGISLRILHQAGVENARQAATLAKLHALNSRHAPLYIEVVRADPEKRKTVHWVLIFIRIT